MYIELYDVKIKGTSLKDAYIVAATWPLGDKLTKQELFEVNLDTETVELYFNDYLMEVKND